MKEWRGYLLSGGVTEDDLLLAESGVMFGGFFGKTVRMTSDLL